MDFPAYADDWHQRPGWPAPEEIGGLVKRLVGEVRVVLDGDQWAVLALGPNGMARVHGGAALWHCCVLLQHLEEVHARGDELVGRIVSRAMVESWFTGLYLYYGKYDALEAIAGDYKHGLVKQHEAARLSNERIRRRHDEAVAFNQTVERDNEGIAARNAVNPDGPQIPVRDPVPVPSKTTLDFDSSTVIARMAHINDQSLPLRTIVDRLAGYTKNTDDETSFSIAYDLTYRGLSGLGAHPTLFVLNSYLDDRDGRGNFVRVRDASAADSLAQANLDSGLLLISTLAARLLGRHGAETPVADEILGRYTLPAIEDADAADVDG